MTKTDSQQQIYSEEVRVETADNEQQVKDFLNKNPDWLITQPELLKGLNLHDQSDGTISLADRQIQQLRKENDLLKKDLKRFLGNAHENETLLHKTFDLCLKLLCSVDIEALYEILNEQAQELFAISHVRMCCFEDTDKIPFAISKSSVKDILGDHFPTNKAITGRLRRAGREFLFEEAEHVASVALIPFGSGDTSGLLAFGSPDEHHFAPENGDLFLNLFARTLTLWLEQNKAQGY